MQKPTFTVLTTAILASLLTLGPVSAGHAETRGPLAQGFDRAAGNFQPPVNRHFIVTDTTNAGQTSHFPGYDPVTGHVLVSNVAAGTVSEVDPGVGVVRVFQAETQPHTVKIAPQRRLGFVTNKGSATVSVLDLKNGTTLTSFPVGSNPHGLELDFLRKRIYVTSIDLSQIEVYDMDSYQQLATVPVGSGPWGVSVNGDVLASTDTGADTIHIIDANTLRVRDVVTVGQGPWNPSVGASGTVYATIGDSGEVVAVRKGKVAWRTSVGTAPRGIVADEARDVVLANVSGDDKVAVLGAAKGRLFDSVSVPDQPAGITYDALTGIAYSASQGAAKLVTVSPALSLEAPAFPDKGAFSGNGSFRR